MKWTHKRAKMGYGRYYSAHPYRNTYINVEQTNSLELALQWRWWIVIKPWRVASGTCESKLMAQRIAENVAELYNDGDVIEC